MSWRNRLAGRLPCGTDQNYVLDCSEVSDGGALGYLSAWTPASVGTPSSPARFPARRSNWASRVSGPGGRTGILCVVLFLAFLDNTIVSIDLVDLQSKCPIIDPQEVLTGSLLHERFRLDRSDSWAMRVPCREDKASWTVSGGREHVASVSSGWVNVWVVACP